ncbi:hypothetical protein ACP70R_005196 [Stipagrostis hirtigluma subsp. patula]
MDCSGLPRCDVIRGNSRCCILCLRDLGVEVVVHVRDLSDHNKREHRGCKNKCNRCSLVFETRDQLRSHVHTAKEISDSNSTVEELPRTRVFRKDMRSCILCLKKVGYEVLVQVKDISGHNAKKHPGCHFSCKDCRLAFETPQQLASHRHT